MPKNSSNNRNIFLNIIKTRKDIIKYLTKMLSLIKN